MKRRVRRGIALLALAGMAVGCSLRLDRPPQPALHDLGPPAELHAPVPARWSAVTVNAPEWLKDPRIRYRLRYADPTQVRFYARDRWVAPPPDLLAQRLAGLGDGGGRYELGIELQDFEQIFDSPGRARVLLRLRATVGEPGGTRVFGEKALRLIRAAPRADGIGAVEGLSRLVNEAAEQLSRWILELPPPR